MRYTAGDVVAAQATVAADKILPPIPVTQHIDGVGGLLNDGITSHRGELMGCDTTMREGDNREALDRESAGNAGRHMLRGGDGAGNYRATA